MRVLIDSNILLDVISKREPFLKYSKAVISVCQQEVILGAITAQTVADVFYILRKEYSYDERCRLLLGFCKILQVIGDGYALAMSEVTERWEKEFDKSYKRFGDPVVLIVTEEPNAFYDDLVISVGVFQKTIQLGTYRYENREQMIKTVPIIMIDSKF